MENYKEKYDNLVETLKSARNDEGKNGYTFKSVIDSILPELRESEDEKIREELIDRFKSLKPNFSWYEIPIDDILSWLEKQKEQKPVEIVNGEDYGVDGLYTALDILKKTLGHVQGYQTDDGMLEHKAAITSVKKLYEQKSVEWSEEDNKNLGCPYHHWKEVRNE